MPVFFSQQLDFLISPAVAGLFDKSSCSVFIHTKIVKWHDRNQRNAVQLLIVYSLITVSLSVTILIWISAKTDLNGYNLTVTEFEIKTAVKE